MVQTLEQRVLPTAVWVASTQNGAEGGQNGTITLQRDNTEGSLMVMSWADGTSAAQSGSDYNYSSTAMFADGSNTAVIDVSILDDWMTEPTETLQINLMSGMPGIPGMDYTISGPSSATIQIFDNDNDPPYINVNQSSFMVSHNQSLTVNTPVVSGYDMNGDSITLELASNVSHGTLSLNADATFTYTPDVSYVGADSFQVRYVDSRGASSQNATISITVMNMAPTLSSQQPMFVVTHDKTLTVTTPIATGYDSDNDTLTLQVVGDVAHGTLTLNADATFTYAPDFRYAGPDQFQVAYVDPLGATSNTMTVWLYVLNMPPVFGSFSPYVSVAENTPVGTTLLNAAATDTDDTSLSYLITSGNDLGYFSIDANGDLKVAQDLNYEAMNQRQFTLALQVTDSLGATHDKAVTVSVTDVNEPPRLVNFDVTTTDGVVFTFTGYVEDETPGGCYVKFGGYMTGHQVACGTGGSFSYAVTLNNPHGLVSAKAYDPLDQASANAYVLL